MASSTAESKSQEQLPSQEAESNQHVSTPRSKKKPFIVSFLVVLFVSIAFLATYWFLVTGNQESKTAKSQKSSSKELTSTDLVELLAYTTTKDGNIGIFNLQTNKSTQITSDVVMTEERIYPFYSNPHFLDENTLVYIESNHSEGKTKIIKKKISDLSEEILFSIDEFAGTHLDLSEDRSKLIYLFGGSKVGYFDLKNFTNKFIYTLPKSDAARGGAFGDEGSVKLSPDGSKILATNSISAPETHMWVIDLDGKLVKAIPTSKDSFINSFGGWYDENKIFYTNDSNKNFYTYNFTNSSEAKKGEGWYFTKISPNSKKLGYSKLKGEFKTFGFGTPGFNSDIYIFDINSGKESLVLANHRFLNWINDKIILASSLRKCEGYDCDPITGTSESSVGYLSDETILVNVDTKEVTKINISNIYYSDFYSSN